MYGANRKRLEALIRDARVAAGRNQNAEARTALQAARRLLALEKDPIRGGERVRAIHAIENQLRTPARAKARQDGAAVPAASGKRKCHGGCRPPRFCGNGSHRWRP